MEHPRRSPAVYRRRRLAALIVLVAVVALAWWGVSAIVGMLGRGGDVAAGTAAPGASGAGASDPAASTEPGDDTAASGAPTDDPAAAGPVHCEAGQLEVTALTDKAAYRADEEPQLSVRLRNASDRTCLIDIGTAKQEYVITSGNDTIWVSTHCLRDPTEQMVEFPAGAEVTSPPVAWVRERSTPDTCDKARPQAVSGGAYYRVTVTVDGFASEPATFVLQ